jgi:hypothetical protein
MWDWTYIAQTAEKNLHKINWALSYQYWTQNKIWYEHTTVTSVMIWTSELKYHQQMANIQALLATVQPMLQHLLLLVQPNTFHSMLLWVLSAAHSSTNRTGSGITQATSKVNYTNPTFKLQPNPYIWSEMYSLFTTHTLTNNIKITTTCCKVMSFDKVTCIHEYTSRFPWAHPPSCQTIFWRWLTLTRTCKSVYVDKHNLHKAH